MVSNGKLAFGKGWNEVRAEGGRSRVGLIGSLTMRYDVRLVPGQAPRSVEVIELPSGKHSIRVDGKEVQVDLVRIGSQLSVRVEGQVVDLTVEGLPPDVGVIAGDYRAYVNVESERMKAASAAKRGSELSGDMVIKSPMPGRVVKVLANAGKAVSPGETLMVLEAMKMENEVKAKAPGVVAELFVAEGATVEANAKLIRIVAAT